MTVSSSAPSTAASSTDPSSGLAAPLPLAPILVPRVWGSHDLGPWFPRATGEPIGEAWLTALDCVVESGPHQGSTLAGVLRERPVEFADGAQVEFPLLVKVLFPREKLSVQVHPDDTRARQLGMPNGKTECWYILSAEPGATVAVGLREPMTGAELRSAIEQGTLEQHLNHIPVKAGDMVYVDAGTVHAIRPGVVVLETQQYSDTTYRLFDYGRPRELHIEEGLAATKSETRAGLVPPRPMDGFTRLLGEQYFFVDRFALPAGGDAPLAHAGLQIVVALEHGASLAGPAAPPIPLLPGHAVVLPAGSGEWTLHARASAEVIRIGRP